MLTFSGSLGNVAPVLGGDVTEAGGYCYSNVKCEQQVRSHSGLVVNMDVEDSESDVVPNVTMPLEVESYLQHRWRLATELPDALRDISARMSRLSVEFDLGLTLIPEIDGAGLEVRVRVPGLGVKEASRLWDDLIAQSTSSLVITVQPY